MMISLFGAAFVFIAGGFAFYYYSFSFILFGFKNFYIARILILFHKCLEIFLPTKQLKC